MKNYLLVSSGSGDSPIYCGACILGEYESLAVAKANLYLKAEKWRNLVSAKDKWRPGYCPEENCLKHADEYWDEDNLTAWRGMNDYEANWERLEIFERNEDGIWMSLF